MTKKRKGKGNNMTKKRKEKIKTASAKAKGRRLQKWVAQIVSEITGLEWGKDRDIESRPMGQSGPDLRLTDKAKKVFPFAVEAKNQEHWQIPAWVRRAEKNAREHDFFSWLLIIKRNNIEPIAIMDARVFFLIWQQILEGANEDEKRDN